MKQRAKFITIFILAFSLAAVFPLFSAPGEVEQTAALKAKKIVTLTGENLENGVILIKGNKIEAVGTELSIPPGYPVFDYGDAIIYPGLINAMTSLGISGISSLDVVRDTKEEGKYNPHLQAFRAFYPWNKLIPITRQFGTTTVVTAPSGGMIPGQAALVRLAGWSPQDMFIDKAFALIIRCPESSRKRKKMSPTSTGFSKAKRELKAYIARAHKYYQRSLKGQAQAFNVRYEAMKPLWSDQQPVIIRANSATDIRFAIELGKEYNLHLILYGVYGGETVTKQIKESGYPVILSSMYEENRDWEDGCDKIFRLAGALEKAGITFCFSTGGASDAFDLPLHAGRAVAYGLSRETAVKALTRYPAEILGLESRGMIAPGKVADLIVTDGSILETSTLVKEVFIDGRRITAKSFFQQEYERTRDKRPGL